MGTSKIKLKTYATIHNNVLSCQTWHSQVNRCALVTRGMGGAFRKTATFQTTAHGSHTFNHSRTHAHTHTPSTHSARTTRPRAAKSSTQGRSHKDIEVWRTERFNLSFNKATIKDKDTSSKQTACIHSSCRFPVPEAQKDQRRRRKRIRLAFTYRRTGMRFAQRLQAKSIPDWRTSNVYELPGNNVSNKLPTKKTRVQDDAPSRRTTCQPISNNAIHTMLPARFNSIASKFQRDEHIISKRPPPQRIAGAKFHKQCARKLLDERRR